jgi:hypothetical protein
MWTFDFWQADARWVDQTPIDTKLWIVTQTPMPIPNS